MESLSLLRESVAEFDDVIAPAAEMAVATLAAEYGGTAPG